MEPFGQQARFFFLLEKTSLEREKKKVSLPFSPSRCVTAFGPYFFPPYFCLSAISLPTAALFLLVNFSPPFFLNSARRRVSLLLGPLSPHPPTPLPRRPRRLFYNTCFFLRNALHTPGLPAFALYPGNRRLLRGRAGNALLYVCTTFFPTSGTRKIYA